MSDFFDDKDWDEKEEDTGKSRNRMALLAFVGALVIALLLVVWAIEDEKETYNDRKIGHKVADAKKKISKQTTSVKKKLNRRKIKPAKSGEKRTRTPSPVTTATQPFLSVVRVLTENASGSGTLLSRKGYFLTNHHVVKGSPLQLILFARDPKTEPEKYFITKTVFENQTLDMAVLQVVRNQGSGTLDHISPIRLGDSTVLKLGGELHIYGYPGVGGKTITMTRGIISGFLQDSTGWIKTDADISPGNSGGGAFTSTGRFIGIPTSVAVDQKPGARIGMVVPVNAIKRYIEPYL